MNKTIKIIMAVLGIMFILGAVMLPAFAADETLIAPAPAAAWRSFFQVPFCMPLNSIIGRIIAKQRVEFNREEFVKMKMSVEYIG